jgi:DNA-binding winged helix-turn-helix (wHTH) protein
MTIGLLGDGHCRYLIRRALRGVGRNGEILWRDVYREGFSLSASCRSTKS